MFAMTVWIMSGISVVAAAISVVACWKISAGAREIRSLHSLQGEIAEIDACVGSLLTTIRRMEGRQTARLGRSTVETSSSAPSLMDKDALRRYAGIVAGQPVRHDNGRSDLHTPERIHGSRAADAGG